VSGSSQQSLPNSRGISRYFAVSHVHLDGRSAHPRDAAHDSRNGDEEKRGEKEEDEADKVER
jgi:hypothetical protein